MTYTIYETAEYIERDNPQAAREHGPDETLEIYYSTEGGREVCLTTDQREEFEADAEIKLTSDTPTDAEFALLLAYVEQNCDCSPRNFTV